MGDGGLRQAYEAIMQGEKDRARVLLRALILRNPRDEHAWMLLSRAVEQPEHAIECLERVLKINPHNPTAANWLEALRAQASLPQKPFATIPAERPSPTQPQPQPKVMPRQESVSTAKERPVTRQSIPPKAERSISRPPRRVMNWPLVLGGIVVLLVAVLAMAGPSLAASDPLEMSIVLRVGDKYLRPPYPPLTPGFPLGSDGQGRDLLSRIMWGVRPTISMVLAVAAVRLLIGTTIGLVAGWSTRWIGRMLDSAIAMALSIPVIIVTLGGIAAVGVELGIWAFIIGLSLTGWVETARIVREQTQTVRNQVYVEASQAMGASNLNIVYRHVLKQILALLWMLFAFEISGTLMLTAALGFLGYYIGGDVWVMVSDATAAAISGMPELGQMLATSGASPVQPWNLVVLGGIVFVIVLGFNLLGEGLRKQLSLYGRSGSSPAARGLQRFNLWLEEYIWHPLANLPRSPVFRPALAILMVLVIVAGWVWWRDREIGLESEAGGSPALQQPGLWASATGDPYGTRFVQASGPRTAEITWTYTDRSGFSGGPVVGRDGTLYVTTLGGVLYALDPQGNALWQTTLPATPVGTPAISQDGGILISDKTGGLVAFSPDGALKWHFQSPEGKPATTGPVVAPEGIIYYVMGGTIQAVSADGVALWRVRPTSPDTSRSQMVQVSPDGSLLFWGDVVLSSVDGGVIAWDSLKGADGFFVGADGKTYFILGHEVTQWEHSNSGASSLGTTTWDYSKFTIARTPKEAGATPEGVIWLFYTGFARGWGFGEDTRLVWLNMGGELLGNSYHPIRNSQVIAVDQDATVFTCGNLEQGYGALECQALSQTSEEPLWTLSLESSEVVGGALVPGRLYVATQGGLLYAIGIAEDLSHAQTITLDTQLPEQMGSGVQPDTSQTGQATDLSALASPPIGPVKPDAYLFFKDDKGFTGGPAVAPDGTVYILSKSNLLYAINPQGEINWQVELPAQPVGTPVVSATGEVYITDKGGSLSAFSPGGELLWRFQSEEGLKAISGPVRGPDGTMYYTGLNKRGKIQAVSSDGDGLWLTELETTQFYRSPELSLSGDYIFFRDEVFDAHTGKPLVFDLPFKVDEFFGGMDGRNYLRAEGTVVEWNLAGSVLSLSDERVLSSEGHPSAVGITPEGVVWMQYNRGLLWFTRNGEALGANFLEDAYLYNTVAIDLNFSVYVCGRRPTNRLADPKTLCLALSPSVKGPLWETIISEKMESIYSGVLIPGRIYVATEEGNLYILGVSP